MGIVIEPEGGCYCRLCSRKKRQDERFHGKKMWHNMQPTCQHEEFYVCTECWATGKEVACSVCACEVFYT